jgi:hypothetical protein
MTQKLEGKAAVGLVPINALVVIKGANSWIVGKPEVIQKRGSGTSASWSLEPSLRWPDKLSLPCLSRF